MCLWGLSIWILLYMPTFRADLDGGQLKQEGTLPNSADVSPAGILETCSALRKPISKSLNTS